MVTRHHYAVAISSKVYGASWKRGPDLPFGLLMENKIDPPRSVESVFEGPFIAPNPLRGVKRLPIYTL